MTTEAGDASERRPRWPWVMLAFGLVWTVLIRVPLILNAEDHLDSDLAVERLDSARRIQRPLALAFPWHALHRHSAPAAFVSAGSHVGCQCDHSGQWWNGHLGVGRRLDLLAGPEGVRARCRGLGDRSAGLLIAGHDLAVGADHGGTSADLGLAHRRVSGSVRLSEPRRLGTRCDLGSVVWIGALSRRDVRVHSGGPDPGGNTCLVPRRPFQRSASLWPPCSWRRSWSASRRAKSAGWSIRTMPIRLSSHPPWSGPSHRAYPAARFALHAPAGRGQRALYLRGDCRREQCRWWPASFLVVRAKRSRRNAGRAGMAGDPVAGSLSGRCRSARAVDPGGPPTCLESRLVAAFCFRRS